MQKILLDCNSFDFLEKHKTKVENILDRYNFYYIYAQDIELSNIKDLLRKDILKTIQGVLSEETAGVFMINTPCINRKCYHPLSKDRKNVETILKKHHCLKNNRKENFAYDLNLALTAFLNGYTVLTNDGAGKKDGLYPALKELGIKCLSHEEFEKLLSN